jgi:hypothetical protein
MSRLSVELLENNDIISKKILQAIADEFNDLINTNINKIRNKIGKYLYKRICKHKCI